MTPSDFLREHLDALVIEWRESTKKSIEYAAEGPHVYTLRIAFVFDNFRCCVADSTARRHGLTVPDDFRQTKISYLDGPYTTGTHSCDEFTLIGFVFVFGTLGFWIPSRDERGRVKEKVFRFDVTELC